MNLPGLPLSESNKYENQYFITVHALFKAVLFKAVYDLRPQFFAKFSHNLISIVRNKAMTRYKAAKVCNFLRP